MRGLRAWWIAPWLLAACAAAPPAPRPAPPAVAPATVPHLACPDCPAGNQLAVVVKNNVSPQFILRGSVNGQDRRFLLDTGAAASSLAPDAFTATLPASGHVSMGGATLAPETCTLLTVDRFEAAGMERRDLQFTRCQEDPTDRFGINLLDGRAFGLSFSRTELTFPAAPPAGAALLPLRRSSQGHLAVRVKVAGVEGFGLFDTGCSVTIVEKSFADRHPKDFSPLEEKIGGKLRPVPADFPDASGRTVHGTLAMVREITVGPLKLARQLVVVAPLDERLRRFMGDPLLVLGANSILAGDWYFDLKANLWTAAPVHSVGSATPGLRVAADEVEETEAGRVLRLRGNARLAQGKNTLAADRIVKSADGRIEATGHCAYRGPDGRIRKADAMTFRALGTSFFFHESAR